MKLMAFAIAMFSLAAITQSHAQALSPITLSPQEYQEIMNQLSARDPVVSFLMQRQLKAQQDAAAIAKNESPKTNVPH